MTRDHDTRSDGGRDAGREAWRDAGRDAGSGAGADEESPASRSGRRRAILALLLLALVSLVTAVPVWIVTGGTTALRGDVPVTVTGTQAAPGIPAAALVLLCAGVAIGLVGRAGRWVLVAAVALSGLLVALSAVLLIADPGPDAATAVAAATGIPTLAAPPTVTAWPYVATAVGLAVLAVAGWLGATSGTWTRPSPRHDVGAPGGGPAGGVVPDDDQAAWDALTRGHDPS